MPKFVRQGNNTLIGNNTFTGTNTFTGSTVLTGGASGPISASTLKSSGVTELSSSSKTAVRYFTTTTDYDAQAATMIIADLLGGVITQNSKTGASTITTPTGTEISAGIANVAVGYTFDVFYHNRGNQTSTITAGASGVTLKGATVAITTLKTAILKFVCTGANTWLVYVNASA